MLSVCLSASKAKHLFSCLHVACYGKQLKKRHQNKTSLGTTPKWQGRSTVNNHSKQLYLCAPRSATTLSNSASRICWRSGRARRSDASM